MLLGRKDEKYQHLAAMSMKNIDAISLSQVCARQKVLKCFLIIPYTTLHFEFGGHMESAKSIWNRLRLIELA